MRPLLNKYIILFLMACYVLPGSANSNDQCRSSLPVYLTMTQEQINAHLDQAVQRFIPLAEQALSHRSKTISIAHQLLDKLEQSPDVPLSGAELALLKEGSAAFLALRSRLYEVAYRYECFQEDIPTGNMLFTDKQRLKGLMISLSSALILYDNYLLAVSIFAENDKLRRVLNTPDASFFLDENQLTNMGNHYTSAFNRRRVRSAIEYYEDKTSRNASAISMDQDMVYLGQLISQSPSYNLVKQYMPLYYLSHKIEFYSRLSQDNIEQIKSDGVSLLSSLFGNAVGMVEFRKGKLYGDIELENHLRSQLRPGDILLEKTPFRLTDKLIPGHWGHVAIWAGTQSELEALGVWEHEAIKPYHDQIQSGHQVIEALRSGIQINPLSQFMNVDDLAIIRPEELTPQQVSVSVIRAFQQIGKAYDFNFDVETTDRIVCSELAYVVYADITWPTDSTLGRYTISPDHIANKALESNGLQLVYLSLDGKTVSSRPDSRLREVMIAASQ